MAKACLVWARLVKAFQGKGSTPHGVMVEQMGSTPIDPTHGEAWQDTAGLAMARYGAPRQGFSHNPPWKGRGMINFRITIESTPGIGLLMHNSRLANPLDPATKALKPYTGKRLKTDEDHETIARLEHAGSLYMDPDVGPYIPSDNVWRCLYDGAKKHRLGVKIKEGVFFPENVNPLSYKGPRDVDGLWKDPNFRLMACVVLQGKRLMRCRPLFREWRTSAEGILDPNVLDFAELQLVARTAGELGGLGDWRPRYGRFHATLEQMS